MAPRSSGWRSRSARGVGHSVPTAAVLALAAAKRGQHTAPFCRLPGDRSVPRATPQWRPGCVSRCCETLSGFAANRFFSRFEATSRPRALGSAVLPSGRRPRSGAAAGKLRAWLSERSEFRARRWREYRSAAAALPPLLEIAKCERGEAASHFSGRRPSSAVLPNARGCDITPNTGVPRA